MSFKEFEERVDYLYQPENRQHERLRTILDSDISEEMKLNLILCEMAVTLSSIREDLYYIVTEKRI